MSRVLRILVLGDSRSFHLERLLPELSRQGCQVRLASVERGDVPHESLGAGKLRLPGYLQAVGPLKKLIHHFQPDLINPHFVSGYGFLAARAATGMAALPIVAHGWGSDLLIVPHTSPLHRWKVRHALQRTAVLITDSDYLARAAGSLHPHLQTRVIPWGLERSAFKQPAKGRPENTPTRIIMNRPLEPLYDPITAVSAALPLLASGRARLSLPARGSQSVQVRQLLRPFEHAVNWYDRLAREPFLRLVADHDIYLSASMSDSSPASLLEALGLGLQAVVADIPGISELAACASVERFAVGDIPSATSAIERVMAHQDRWNQLSNQNRAQIGQTAIFEENVAATIDIFRSVIKRHEP